MKPKLVLLGSGGHAKVTLEILEENGEVEIIGCTTREAAEAEILGYPVLGTDDLLPALHAKGVRHAFVALGDNRVRSRVMGLARALGFSLVNAISVYAKLSRRVTLEDNVAVMSGAVVNVDTVLASGCIVNTGATVDHDCSIGKFAHIAPGSNLAGRVRIGEGAFLGTGTRVIPGVSIGAWTKVGAGAVVIRDLPDHVTAVGVPALVKKCQV